MFGRLIVFERERDDAGKEASPLQLAVAGGRVRTARLLIDNGADITARLYGRFALSQIAAHSNGHLEQIVRVLETVAEARAAQWTSLSLAHQLHSAGVVDMLPFMWRSCGVFALTRLRTLDLSCNQLRAVPSTIGQLRALEVLDLHDNQLDDLPVGTVPVPTTSSVLYCFVFRSVT